MNQTIYLDNIKLKQAIELIKSKLKIAIKYEEIKTVDAFNRITYESVNSKISNPFYNCSAMDGIATNFEKTNNASEKKPVILKLHDDYEVLDTGDPIPDKFDTVIMIEDVIKIDKSTIKIHKSHKKYENVRLIGEDIIQDTMLITRNHKIRSVDMGGLLACGVDTVKVYKKPVIGIIPTGTEIVELNSNLSKGDIVEFNSKIMSAELSTFGGEVIVFPIVDDDYELIKNEVKKAVDKCDVVIINAGSSAGREDFTSSIIEDMGKLYVHGIAIKPGKPTILGSINEKLVIGVPGYPVSAFVVIKNVVIELLKELYYTNNDDNDVIEAKLSKRLVSTLKYEEFVRVKIGYINNEFIALPLSKNAGSVSSLINADGIMSISQNVEGIEKGEQVQVKITNTINKIKKTIIHTGSHDPVLDIISDILRSENSCYLSTNHVGSTGGLLAMRNNECHFSTIHLLDENTGEYNKHYIDKYLDKENVVSVKFLKRKQGIMCREEHYDIIKNIQDIVSNKLVFINRQKGSGTRVLFDYILKKENINKNHIIGYENQEFTHFSVANGIAEGLYDCGMGVYSAAKAMGLKFIPIEDEDYDIITTKEFFQSDNWISLYRIIKSKEFYDKVNSMGGYEII